MIDPSTIELIERRARRASATILGFKDRECTRYLPAEVDEQLRKIILDQVNELAHLAVDCLNVEGEQSNQLYKELLDDIRGMLYEDD